MSCSVLFKLRNRFKNMTKTELLMCSRYSSQEINLTCLYVRKFRTFCAHNVVFVLREEQDHVKVSDMYARVKSNLCLRPFPCKKCVQQKL